MTSKNYYSACCPKASIQPQNHHCKHCDNQDSNTKTNEGNCGSSNRLDHKKRISKDENFDKTLGASSFIS